MKKRTETLMERFFTHHSRLIFMQEEIKRTVEAILAVYQNGGKVLLCGNGGSCADADHIVGELMKGFLLKRPLPLEKKQQFLDLFGEEGKQMARDLQEGIPAISLCNHAALNSAFANDQNPTLIYAQQVMGYGRKGDLLIGISTSGNADNVVKAMMAAKALGLFTVALVGKTGGRMAELADCALVAPAKETFLVQEQHIAIYHLICAAVESEAFEA